MFAKLVKPGKHSKAVARRCSVQKLFLECFEQAHHRSWSNSFFKILRTCVSWNVEQERKLFLTVCSHFMPSLDITKKLIETFLALLFNKNDRGVRIHPLDTRRKWIYMKFPVEGPDVFCKKMYSWKFRKIHKKTPVP